MARTLPATQPRTPAAALSESEYWAHTPVLVAVMVFVVVVRLQEFVSVIAALKPALLVSVGGTALLLGKSSPRVVREVFALRLPRLVLALFAFALVTAPLALWSGWAFQTLQSFFPTLPLLLGFFFCAPTLRALRRVQASLVLMVGIYAAHALVRGESIGEGRMGLSNGMYDSNDMAALTGLCFPLAVGLALRARGKERLLAVAAAVLVVSVVAASGSRGGILGTAAGALVLALGMRGARRAVSIVVVTVAAAGVWTFSDASFRERMASMTNLEEDYNATAEVGRQQVWKRGIGYFKEDPIIGVGFGNFPMAEGEHFRSLSRGGKWSTAHNTYIQVLVELGLIGGGIFVAILLTAIRGAWRLVRREPGADDPDLHQPELLAALVTYMVAGFFLSHAYFYPYYALLGMIGLANRVRQASVDAPNGGSGVAPRPDGPRRAVARTVAPGAPLVVFPGSQPARGAARHAPTPLL